MKFIKYAIPISLGLLLLVLSLLGIQKVEASTGPTVEYFDFKQWNFQNEEYSSDRMLMRITNITQDTIIISEDFPLVTKLGSSSWTNGPLGYLPSSNPSVTTTLTGVQGDTLYFLFPKVGSSSSWTNKLWTFTEIQNITVTYENPSPTFQTETATFNYNMGNAEIVLTSPEPTFDSANITGRGILIGRSDTGTTSPSQLTVNEGGGVYPKTGPLTGSHVITFTNIQPNVTYYFRSYVEYNDYIFYYSDGIELTTSSFNERTIDYINWNGEVVYTTELPVGSDITQRDLTAQNFITGREGYRFLGWTGDTTVTEEFRVFERTAQWEQVITYDVTFTDYDDSIIEVVTVEQGETAVPTQTPTRTGYIFAYWEPPVTDIQGNLTTKAIYYVVITWRGLNDELIRIDNVLENEPLSPPARAGYVRVWNSPATATVPATYTLQSETIEQNSGVTESGVTQSGTTIIYRTQLPDDYSGITDLFGGVFGAIIGTVMILGTIDLFGVQLSSLFWLFFAGSGFFMMWRFVK